MSTPRHNANHAHDRECEHLTTGLNVLVAEDNPDGAETMARLLRREGHAVRVAPDGGTAVAAALKDPPDVVLLDIGLPVLDGWEAARRIRAGLEGRPCLMIAVTGHDGPGDRLRSLRAGIQLHLPKPVDPQALGVLLSRYEPPAV
jgi:CheY-like chemotaxis protein